MNRVSLLLVFFVTLVCSTQPASAVTIDWVTVGDPGNAADTIDGDRNSKAVPHLGAVNYEYRIGKYAVTNRQYAAFLNSNDPTGQNTLSLYINNTELDFNGGITYNDLAPPGEKYSPRAGREQHPVNFVDWFSAIRFANWLNNGQVPGSTETGAYTILGGQQIPTNATEIVRNPGAPIFLPSEDEWYKAAYYDSTTSTYFRFPTSSNEIPTKSGPTATPNSANYDGAVLTLAGQLTDVGAYTGTTSPWGVFDMGGNVSQWTESKAFEPTNRIFRGGSFADTGVRLLSDYRQTGPQNLNTSPLVGLRMAAVIPEPSTGVMAAIACGVLLVLRTRLKKQRSSSSFATTR